jgi:TonB family protein
MREVPTPLLEKIEPTFPEPRLLVVPEAGSRIFLQNLWGLFHSREGAPLHLESAPGAFWSDVFVERKLPWRRFLESGGYHLLALIVVWAGSRFLALQPNVTAQPTFSHADVVYYTPSEYLPPLDTLRSPPAQAEKADPEFSAQPIISVPPEADNHSQTIVTAPKIRLQHDLPLANTVAWSDKPLMPIAPAPLVPASEISRLAPQMDRSVIAPPPDVDNASQKTMPLPQVAVIAPPPALEATSDRRLGELNIGHSTVIGPAPQLYLDEQRTVAQGRSVALRGHATQVIAPPPSVSAPGGSRNGGGMIALSLHPAAGAPPAPVAGNRRGNFAATPEGHRGASGAPGGSTPSAIDGSASGKNSTGKLPSGLYVGKTANPTSPIAGDLTPTKSGAHSVNPKLLADARPPRVSRTTQPESDSKISEAERAVFGNRKIYSLSLNMPNLNSAGGSWVIRFAALKPDSSPGNSSASLASSELSSPVAKRKVDPAYPLELMRQNVAGTVILYGVIHSDGTVGNVRVLRSVDDRLDQFASEAIAKCQFEPAMKNGSPVDVEATFWIPFRPSRVKSDF